MIKYQDDSARLSQNEFGTFSPLGDDRRKNLRQAAVSDLQLTTRSESALKLALEACSAIGFARIAVEFLSEPIYTSAVLSLFVRVIGGIHTARPLLKPTPYGAATCGQGGGYCRRRASLPAGVNPGYRGYVLGHVLCADSVVHTA